jgi:hypothetical protein
MGGVGTVFTREDARRRGLAEKLLEWAATDMTARGMCVSVLFAARIPWYSRLGWRSFGVRRTLLERGSGGPSESTGPEAEAFVPERDLAAVRALYEAYSGDLPGVARDDALWQASLRNSGNPEEEFLVARAGGELVAYLRAVVLSGILVVMEFGRTPGFEDALARLFVELMEPRVPDPLATGAKPSAELRRVASTVGLHFDPDLGAALARRGIIQKEHADPTCMLRCMDADALGSRLGVPRQEGEAPNDFLFRMLPPEDLTFWPADRF